MNNIAAYFNGRAEEWAGCEPGASPVQGAVAALAGCADGRVIDAGCGTGTMVAHYLAAGAREVVGVDVAEEMVARARKRFANETHVRFIACDICDAADEEGFDALVIYNAYPHMLDKHAVVEAAARLVVPGGRFVIAHGTGRDEINRHHAKEHVSDTVSCELRSIEEEIEPWKTYFDIDTMVEAPGFYAFAGQRK